jgi:tetratricopeptide (TPR) repeat protein
MEAALERSPADAALLRSLGDAYRASGRSADAIPLLERAAAASPGDSGTPLLLGLAYEDAGRYEDAIGVYAAYASAGANRALRRSAADRVGMLRRRQLVEAAREAVSRESELAGTAPEARALAVFPFLHQSDDEGLRPLGHALADLLITDLSQTDRLRVVDRLQVDAMIAEARLAESGLVDPATAARGGRLLGAGRVVQGSVSGTPAALQLEAAVVGVGGEADGRIDPIQERDALARLFDMQKRMALEIYRSAGIELTSAEQERVLRRPTRNIQALLAYGLAIEAESGGDLRAAREFYGRAQRLDPGFAAARERLLETERILRAEDTPTDQIAFRLGAEDPLTGLNEIESLVPIGGGRDASAEVLGQDALGVRGGMIRVILR